MLLVGNHSGGNMTPDTLIVFTLAFSTYFGVERPFYQLAHNLVARLAARPDPAHATATDGGLARARARRRSSADAAVLVYPGGDWEVHRPTWERNQIDFAGRKGFIRLALDADVPIVPVVSIGGPGDGAVPEPRRLARAKLRRSTGYLRLKVLPISIALPWSLNVGDLLGHLPLPAKITIEVLAADRPPRAVRATTPTSTRSTTTSTG